MAKIDNTGYIQKTQNQYYSEQQQLYQSIDINWNLDPSTPDGLKLASDAEHFANMDEVALQAYNSKDPDSASGVDLDIICALTGTVRQEGTASTVVLLLTGDTGTTVPADSVVTPEDSSSQWLTDDDVVIGSDGTTTVNATCSVVGATQANANTLNRIAAPLGGWQSVTNPSAAIAGVEKQTDGSLRLSRNQQVASAGSNQLDNVRGAISSVDGVTSVFVDDNDTDTTDSRGIPARNVFAIVEGGTDDAVAMAIYLKKNPGAPWYHAATPVTVDVTSPNFPAMTTAIKFSRPVYVDIQVAIGIQSDGTILSTTVQDIKNAIIAYAAGGSLAASCGFNTSGYSIGEDVSLSRVYTPVNKIIGALGNSYVTELTLQGGSDTTVPIAFNAISRWTDANIVITIEAPA